MKVLALGAETSRRVFEFGGLPEGWGRLIIFSLLAVLCYWSVALYHRERRAGASRPIRVALAALHAGTLLHEREV